MQKDRDVQLLLGDGSRADILYRTTTRHPTEYPILLRRIDGDKPQVVLCIDNSHVDYHVDEHHMHRYRDGQRCEGEPLPFAVADTNDAMHKVIGWLADNWEELIT